jgi:hypothetical protein
MKVWEALPDFDHPPSLEGTFQIGVGERLLRDGDPWVEMG